ncbi:proteinase-activated receptor 4-like [Eucyclogobius newberryi]|uniref:proteinase-activated receptor 4-like n=1 Tax=Eucyclogobius newberryi TaxID=166745 RepID=UPI003B5BF04D
MRLVWTLVLVLVLDFVSGEDLPDVCSSMTVRLRSFRIVSSPCNFTTLREEQRRSVRAWPLVLALPLLQVLVLVLALPSNALALWILLFRSKRLPSTALLVNLTVCDLLLLLALPFRAVYHFSGNDWRLGEPLCRLVVALFYGNMYGSVLCLAFIAADRYVALVHPFGAKAFRSRRTSLLMVALVWAAVAGAMLPLLLTRQTFDLDEPKITTCHDALPQSSLDALFRPYFLCLFCLCFAVPLLVVLFCHAAVLRTLLRQRQRYARAVRATALVLSVFTMCFVPSNVLLLLSLWDEGEGAEPDRHAPYMLSLALSAFNTVLDPFIYYYVSSDFRDKALSALCCRSEGAAASGQRTSCERPASSGQPETTKRTSSTGLDSTEPTNQSTEV